jgi:hypothetical protein
MSEVRWVRSFDGEASGNECFVEETVAQIHVREKAVETIPTFDVELDADVPRFQASPGEQGGFLSEALPGLVGMLDLRMATR